MRLAGNLEQSRQERTNYRSASDIYRAMIALRAAEAGEFVLVPREATADMVQAMEDRHVEGATYIAENSIQFALWKEVWKAAILAAPLAPGGQNAAVQMNDATPLQAANPAAAAPDKLDRAKVREAGKT
jgi:hypothetical protein